MAYKFQSGLARLGGTVSLDSRLEVSGALDLADQSIAVADLNLGGATSYNLAGGSDGALAHTDELIVMDDSDSDNGKVMTLAQLGTYMSGADPTFAQVSGALSGADAAVGFGHQQLIDILNVTASNSVTAGTEFVIGSAAINEAELETLDGVTAGTVAASKVVVVDSDKDASGFRDISGRTVSGSGNATFLGNAAFDGSVTAGSSFIIGSADLNEADLEQLDGITAGTVAASKAVVVDANKDASGFRNITATGNISGSGDLTAGDGKSIVIGNASMNEADLEKLDGITNGTVAANKAVVVDANKDAGGFRNITAVQIGHADDTDLMVLSDGKLTVNGDLDISGIINKVTTRETELAIEDIRIIIGSGSAAASDLDGGGIIFGSGSAGVDVAKIQFNDAAEDEIAFMFSGSEKAKFNAGGDLELASGGQLIIGNAALTEAELETIDGVTAGTAAASKAMVLDASADIAGGRNLNITGMLLAQTMVSGAALDVNDSAFAVGSDGGIAVATNAFTVSAAGAVAAAGNLVTQAQLQVGTTAIVSQEIQAGTLKSTGSVQLGFSSQGFQAGVAGTTDNNDQAGVLALVSASADGYGAEFFTGPLLGEGAAFSGTILANGYPSFIEVVMTGSEAVYLKLPDGTLGAGDAGKVLTIKKRSLHEGPLVLTGSGGVAGLFDGTLQALTMSSPMAAVNLVWNGSGYNLY